MPKKTRIELFLELAKPDQNWISRRVKKDEFRGEYSDLYFENWCSWGRSDGNLAKQYIIEYNKSLTPWNRVDAIRLNGFNKWEKWTQNIKADIKKHYKDKRCVILDTSGPEVDHKNWWKNDLSVMNSSTQKLEDFQPLSKAANDAKRQHCKICMRTGERFDAKKLWYPISYTEWGKAHNWRPNGCVWCFRYDPIDFRKHLKEK